jgi:hypothetical protein
MQPGRSYTRFLRGRTPDEVRVRTLQFLNVCFERLGLSSQAREPTDIAFLRHLEPLRPYLPELSSEALLAHFRQRPDPRCFAGFAKPAATLEALRRRWPDAERTAVANAEEIQRGEFDLFGWSGAWRGEDPDWHLEPRAGTRAPLRHWSRIRFLDPQLVGDCRITWELNRHQYFITLGRAYCYTGDEAFARTFVRHVTNWMTANPPKVGINWVSSLEVAFRAISWLWALQFFRLSPELSASVLLRMLKFLYVHARHLETYLSTYFSPNTHLSGEALGLFYLGTLLPEFTDARRWQDTGWRILREQLARQVRGDGVYFEQASHYHRYTTDFYTHAYVLAAANDLPDVDSVGRALQGLLDHLMYLTRPDGTTPFVGDDDGGQLAILDQRAPNDFRGALATGAVLFERSDYAYVAREPAQETLWLLGPQAVQRFHDLQQTSPAETSRAFAASGYFVMRDSWRSDASYALIDCGPHGALTFGHAHADALALEIVARGTQFLTDSGTYTYTGSLEERNYFRSSSAHNTVTIDGQSSSIPASAFRWSHVASSRLSSWVTRPRVDYFEGAHDGYERLKEPATHHRSVLFLKNDYWVLRDRIESTGSHEVTVHFHCPPGVGAQADGDNQLDLITADADGREARLRMAAFAPAASFVVEREWVSPSYARREQALACRLRTGGLGPQEVITFLVPYDAGSSAPHVREVEASRGRAFLVTTDDAHDTLLVGARTGEGGDANGVVTDANWAWVRRSSSGEVLEFVLLAGRSLTVDGTMLFCADDTVDCVVNGASLESSDLCAASAE